MVVPHNISRIADIDECHFENPPMIVFDTNICIDLYKLWCNPRLMRNEQHKQFMELVDLCTKIYKNGWLFFPHFGIEEASFSEFSNRGESDKEQHMHMALLNLLGSDLQSFLAHINSTFSSIEHYTRRVDSKSYIRRIRNDIIFSDLLPLKYCSMMKLFILCNDIDSYKERLFEFFNYLLNNINCVDVGSIITATFLTSRKKMKMLFHRLQNSSSAGLRSILNSAIDLTFIELSSRIYLEGLTPIFCSQNKLLIEIENATKVQIFQNGIPAKGIYADRLPENEVVMEFIEFMKKSLEKRDSYIKHFNKHHVWAEIAKAD